MDPVSPWLGPQPLLLASTSPTRRLLLEGAGLPVETEAPGVDERAVEAACAGLAPPDLARWLAEAKTLAVARRHPDRVVVGADQVLALGDTLFHKPTDLEAAGAQIARLAGRTHHLHAAFAVAHGAEIVAGAVETASLTMRPLDEGQIAAYLACAGESRLCASVGGYQLEGLGIHLFEHVAGEHSTILGLPLLPLLAALRADGWLRF